MTQRYARETTVPIATSEAQLKQLLRAYGADAIYTFEERTRGMAAVAFRVHGRAVRLTLPLPNKDDIEFTHKGTRGNKMVKRGPKVAMAKWEQACRARWRLLVLLVKGKLEAIEAEVSTFDREFLADIMLPSGETFSEAVAQGKADKLLGAPGKTVPLLAGPPAWDPNRKP